MFKPQLMTEQFMQGKIRKVNGCCNEKVEGGAENPKF